MSKSPIVARINSLLAEKGISKQEFYDACHITSATYSLWNTGKTTPRMKNLENISVYLHTTIARLVCSSQVWPLARRVDISLTITDRMRLTEASPSAWSGFTMLLTSLIV